MEFPVHSEFLETVKLDSATMKQSEAAAFSSGSKTKPPEHCPHTIRTY